MKPTQTELVNFWIPETWKWEQLAVPGAETASTESPTVATSEAFNMANWSTVMVAQAHPLKSMALWLAVSSLRLNNHLCIITNKHSYNYVLTLYSYGVVYTCMHRGLREARRMSNMKKNPNRALSIAIVSYHSHLDQYINKGVLLLSIYSKLRK